MQPVHTSAVGDEIATPDHIASAIDAPAIEPRHILQESIRDWQTYLDTGEAAYADVAGMRLMLLIKRWERDRGQGAQNDDDPHSGTSAYFIMRDDFFVWERIFQLYEGIVRANVNHPDLDQALRTFATQTIRPMERGPNNRSLHFALGALRAARLFPDLPQSALWSEYAEAVWKDWFVPGDSYEPGYVAHHFAQTIELARLLGHREALCSRKSVASFRRLAQHVAPSGRVIQPGDGGERDQEAYARGLLLATLETKDPELAWAAQLNHAMGNDGPRDPESVEQFKQQLEQKGIVAKPPTPPFQGVQHLFSQTHPVADRLILQPPDSEQSPYLALYLNDQTETTFHGHEDNRGEIYHYEVKGDLLLRREGWSKWPGHANTFMVTDAVDEFPHYYTKGMVPGHLYKARSNLRLLRHYLESDQWESDPVLSFQGMHAFRERARPDLGYTWANPDALVDIPPPFPVKEIVIRWVNLPERLPDISPSHYLQDLDFIPGMAWYREHRSVAPASAPYRVELGNLTVSGPDGTRILLPGDTIPHSLILRFYPAGAGRDTDPILLEGEARKKWIRLITKSDGTTALELECPPGRMDLVFRDLEYTMDLRKDHWLELDYRLDEAARNFLRPPLRLIANELAPRSMYPDRQQGGCLVVADTQVQQADSFARIQYDGIWTHDSQWERKTVLTAEGFLVVLDTFFPGPSADGLAGGPVWQLAAPPVQGLHWFDAPSFSGDPKRLMVYFHPARGKEYGVRFQPKLWDHHHGYAVYAREVFKPHRVCRFLTVFIPHAASIAPEDVSGKRHFHGGIDSQWDPAHGLQTSLDEQGNASVQYRNPARALTGETITMCLNGDHTWNVCR